MDAKEQESYERARAQLAEFGLDSRVVVFPVSSATVELAAQALGCEPKRIAKTLSFKGTAGGTILLVAAGDARTDNHRFKAEFGVRPRMLSPEEVIAATGHAVGGVCPFGLTQPAEVFLDVSLQRFDYVYPACGTHNTGVKLTPAELERSSRCTRWVDVCKGWRGAEPATTAAADTPAPAHS